MMARTLPILIVSTLMAACLWPPSASHAQTAVSEAAHQQFVFAYRLLQQGERDLAIEAFDEYLGKFPRDEKRGDGLYFRALLARQQGRLQQAQDYLEMEAPAPILVPSSARWLLQGEVALELNQHAKALKALEAINPDSLEPTLRVTTYFLRGQAHRGLGHHDAAATHFEQAAAIDSSLRPRAMLELAHTRAKLGQLDKAIQAARSAATSGDATISPQAAQAAGDFAYQAGQYAQALDYYQLVLTNYTTSPQAGQAVVGAMWALLEMKQYQRILTTFDEYQARLSPRQRVTAWYLAGSAHQERGEHDKAVGLFNSLVLGSVGSSVEDRALYKLAYSQAELGQYEQALQTVARLHERNPDSPRVVDADFLLTSLDARRGDLPGAIARVTAMIDRGASTPYHLRALLLRAQLHEKASQPDKAAQDYTAFLTLSAKPATSPDVNHLSLAQRQEAGLRLLDIRFHQNRFDDAAKAAADLLAMKDLPADMRHQALFRQAIAQVRLNQLAPAEASFSELLALSPPEPLAAQAVYYRGLARLALKKTQPAMTDFQQAITQDQLPAALKINALKLLSIHLRESGKPQPTAAVLAQLEKLAGLSGLSASELLWLGDHQLTQGQPAASLKYLRPLIAREVDITPAQRAVALGLTARALRQVKDLPAAISAYQEAIAAGHGSPGPLRLELAATFAQADQLSQAIDEYHGLINAPQSSLAAKALHGLAELHLDQARKHLHAGDAVSARESRLEARKLLKRLVLLYAFPELSPLPQITRVQLADLELALQQPDEALAELHELAERHPDTPYAEYAKAVTWVIRKTNRADALFILRKLAKEPGLDAALAQAVASHLKSLEGQS